MIATLPLAHLFFFHILLIKKGISTYDYIIALREQKQQGVGAQHSSQMSPVSSVNALQRAAWCTPPRLFVQDQYDVVPPETGSVTSFGKKSAIEEPVKINPWTLARLNAAEVAKSVAEARKKSKILQPPYPLEREGSFSSSSRRMNMRPDNNRKQPSKRIRLPADLPFEPMANTSSLVSLNSRDYISSNASTSLDSPDIHPFRISSSGAEESRRHVGLSTANLAELPLSRSTSDGYNASGGEDSDRVSNGIAQRSTNWNSILFG